MFLCVCLGPVTGTPAFEIHSAPDIDPDDIEGVVSYCKMDIFHKNLPCSSPLPYSIDRQLSVVLQYFQTKSLK